MNRTPEELVNQATTFLYNLGAAQSMSYILAIDSVFKDFLVTECGLDVNKVEELSQIASVISNKIKNENGIVTVENAERFLKRK